MEIDWNDPSSIFYNLILFALIVFATVRIGQWCRRKDREKERAGQKGHNWSAGSYGTGTYRGHGGTSGTYGTAAGRKSDAVSGSEPNALDTIFRHSGGFAAESGVYSYEDALHGGMAYYDSNSKKRIGSSHTFNGMTTYYDSKGKKIGTSSSGLGGEIVFRDSSGREIGTGHRDGRTTTYYDSKKRMIGRSDRNGSGEDFTSYRRT